MARGVVRWTVTKCLPRKIENEQTAASCDTTPCHTLTRTPGARNLQKRTVHMQFVDNAPKDDAGTLDAAGRTKGGAKIWYGRPGGNCHFHHSAHRRWRVRSRAPVCRCCAYERAGWCASGGGRRVGHGDGRRRLGATPPVRHATPDGGPLTTVRVTHVCRPRPRRSMQVIIACCRGRHGRRQHDGTSTTEIGRVQHWFLVL